MSPAPWWAAILVGVLTVAGSYVAARLGSQRTDEATRQRGLAAAREEWFRRVQWAVQLTLSDNARASTAGYQALTALGQTTLAGDDDRELLLTIAESSILHQQTLATQQAVDEPDFVIDDQHEGDEERGTP